MKKPHWVIAACLLGLVSGHALATSVRPPQFSDLVRRADYVVRGQVSAVRSEWRGTGATHRIVTLVTVHVERTIVGAPQKDVELEFLGGTVDGRTLTVTDQPQFSVGDRDILFVEHNHRQFCPLVAMGYGRYPLVRDPVDASRELVARENGAPLRTVNDVSQPMAGPAPPVGTKAAQSASGPPMPASDFESRIRQAARAAGRQDLAP